MTRNGVEQEITLALGKMGYEGRVVAAQHINDLRNSIEEHHSQNLFDTEFYEERISVFKYELPAKLPVVRSVIIVAVPQPQVRVGFEWHGKVVSLIIPPTYSTLTDKNVEQVLARILTPLEHGVVRASLPLKLLAVRSGLATYGRNNISYVPGMGSFHRLVAYYSDLPCDNEAWQRPQMMERCKKCSACLQKCPTGAITSERFLIRAERCITYLNEKPGHVPFPDWLDQSWHNCLVGCLHCQKACPENKDFLSWIKEGAVFSEEETNVLLRGVSLDQVAAPTLEKLREMELEDSLDSLPRNLGVLFKEPRL